MYRLISNTKCFFSH